MVRIIETKIVGAGLKYIEAAGLSDDEKPEAGIGTGSIFLEVDTGDMYAFDEIGGNWNKIVSGGGQ